MAQTNEIRDQLINSFTTALDSVVSTFLDSVLASLPSDSKHTKDSLYKLWSSSVAVPKKRATTSSTTTATSTTRKPSTKATSDRPQCKHIMGRGKNKGAMCASKAKEGSEYCGKHVGNYPSASSTATATTASSKTNESESESEDSEKVTLEVKGKSYALVKEGKYLVNRTSGFAFDDNKTVVGKIVKGKLESLTDSDLERCKSEFGFTVSTVSQAKPKSSPSKNPVKDSGKDSDSESDSGSDSDSS